MESEVLADDSSVQKMKQYIQQIESLATDIKRRKAELEKFIEEMTGDLQQLRSECDARQLSRKSLKRQWTELEEGIRNTKQSLEDKIACLEDAKVKSTEEILAEMWGEEGGTETAELAWGHGTQERNQDELVELTDTIEIVTDARNVIDATKLLQPSR